MTQDRQNGPLPMRVARCDLAAAEVARSCARFSPPAARPWRGSIAALALAGLGIGSAAGAVLSTDRLLLARVSGPPVQLPAFPSASVPQPVPLTPSAHPAGAGPEVGAFAAALSIAPRVILGAPEVRPPARPARVEDVLAAPAGTVAAAMVLRPRPRPADLHVASAVSDAPLRPRARPDEVPMVARAAMPGLADDPGGGRSFVMGVRPMGRPMSGGGRTLAAVSGCPAALVADIPARARDARSGSALAERMVGLGGAERDDLILRELLAGNLPGFLRRLTPVTVTGVLPGRGRAEVTFCVMPDYLALGGDGDFLRVPMGLPAAARVADGFGFLLPTTRMVDAIHEQAGLRLAPQPMTPGAQMSSTRYFWQHNRTVEDQMRGREGVLTSGQKKDLVLTNRLRESPGRVAIYGWHRSDGAPIQPLSTVHGARYADYSHGVRLVSKTAFVGGRAVPLAELLADPAYAPLLTGEGPITAPERLLASLYR